MRPPPKPAVRVVIPSHSAENLIPCVHSILECQPTWEPDRIIVVDDGARAEAESQLPGIQWVDGVKPFIFARNVNLGIAAAAPHDVIVMNDDAQLRTPGGFDSLEDAVRTGHVGICSAGIRGVVCNPNQVAQGGVALRLERALLAFVCVFMPRDVLNRVGPLDERFVGYGFEDFDYCRRVQDAGYELAVWHRCCVAHTGDHSSVYRTRPDIAILMDHNRRLYDAKWGLP